MEELARKTRDESRKRRVRATSQHKLAGAEFSSSIIRFRRGPMAANPEAVACLFGVNVGVPRAGGLS